MFLIALFPRETSQDVFNEKNFKLLPTMHLRNVSELIMTKSHKILFFHDIACYVSNLSSQGHHVGKFGIGSQYLGRTAPRNCCLFRL